MSMLSRLARRRALRADYRAVFGTAAGGRVLADMARRGQLDRHLHDADSATETAFNLGYRKCLMDIWQKIDLDERALVARVAEAVAEDREEN